MLISGQFIDVRAQTNRVPDVDQIGAGLEYEMAQKGGANAKFVDELDRNFLEKKLMKRQFADSSQARAFHLRLNSLCHELLRAVFRT